MTNWARGSLIPSELPSTAFDGHVGFSALVRFKPGGDLHVEREQAETEQAQPPRRERRGARRSKDAKASRD